MPVTPTYPGVYIEEVRSQVRTIVGVATSITAFIGRALRGPVDEPTLINNFGDFQRTFGGLWAESTLGFAVQDFYQNGGSQAIIVRLYNPNDDTGKATLKVGGATPLSLEAISPGKWGNFLRARVDSDVLEDVAKAMGVKKADLFNLTIRDTRADITEVFRNLTIGDQVRNVKAVVEAGSNLVRVTAVPSAVPESNADAGSPEEVWAEKAANGQENKASTGVKTAGEGSDGVALTNDSFTGGDTEANKEGLYALEKADIFNILCIPPYLANVGRPVDAHKDLVSTAATYCEGRRAFLLVDPPSAWTTKKAAVDGIDSDVTTTSKNAALFFPRLKKTNPFSNLAEEFVPCGAVAGIMARTDASRGVWKAPAGLDATIVGVPELSVPLTDLENGELNQLGVNCLRSLPAAGRVVWGARTLQGDDRLTSEWKYIPVRRLALYLEESLYRGTQWVVFEPNDEPLWAQIRLNVGAFMNTLFRQGAFQGKTPSDAYFVKCDSETTTQDDINRGVVNILVGFAPLKPAEFVIIKISQMAGQIQT